MVWEDFWFIINMDLKHGLDNKTLKKASVLSVHVKGGNGTG